MRGKSLPYRPEIDGLRAFALLTILLFHVRVPGLPGGFLSVDIFFVISGFLITAILLRDLERGTFSLRAFWMRRARRILPALFVILGLCVVPAWLILFPEQLRSFGADLAASITFAANFRFWLTASYFAPDAKFEPLIHVWTLAVEEQFYLGFPLLMLGLWNFGRKAIFPALLAIGLASFALAALISPTRPELAFYLLPTRAWELATGAAMAWCMHYRAPQFSRLTRETGCALALIAILASFVLFDETMAHPGFITLPVMLGSAAFILFGNSKDRFAGLLASKPMVAIGLFSYSGYLWHQPLYAFFENLNVLSPTPLETALIIGATLALAYVTWRLVERPMMDRSRMGPKFFAVFIAVGLTSLAAVSAALWRSDGYPERFSDRQVELAQMIPSRGISSQVCNVDAGASDAMQRIGECFVPGRTVYLMGDSHAASIAPELTEEAARRGISLISLARPGCFPLAGVINRWRAECPDGQSFLDSLPPEYEAPVILSARWRFKLTGSPFDNGEGGVETGRQTSTQVPGDLYPAAHARLEEALRALSARRQVIVIGQIPEAGWNVPMMMARGRRAGDLTTSFDRYRAMNAGNLALFSRLEREGVIEWIRPEELVCTAETARCSNVLGDEPLYVDNNHPAPIYATMIASQVFDRIAAEGLLSID